MALNIKNPEAERLAGEVAAMTGETKTAAIVVALRERHERLLRGQAESRGERSTRRRRALEEIWALLPPGALGQEPLTKAEREEILGIGRDGV